MFKKIAILLGRKTDTRGKMLDVSEKPKNILKGILFGILLATCNLSNWIPLGQLATVVTPVHAEVISTNTANMNWTDERNTYYAPISDTAAIRILNPPILLIAKDVRNLRTGETSTDIVTVIHGDTVEFALSITNTGDTDARNIVMFDSIPFSTVYETGSALDTTSFDTSSTPDTISFQHMAGGEFDLGDTGTITAVKWEWIRVDGVSGDNKKAVRFKVKVQ